MVIVVSCFVLLLSFSCQDKQDALPQNELQNENNEFFVTENAATFFADNFAKELITTKKNSLKSKKLKTVNKITDEKGEELIYVINYEDGGFLLLSADKRVAPVLAFSETNSFTSEESDLRGGVNFWVQTTKEGIKSVKKENKEQSEEVKFLWNKYLSSSSLKVYDPENPPPCQDVYTWVGPLMQTKWDQGCTFNSLLDPCSNPDYCNKVPAGCVAVAMAQVMKYHQYPSSYSWSSMPNTYGTSATAGLMYDLGVPSALDMDYTCSNSTVSSYNIVPTFENVFSYSTSATHANYNQATVKYEIDYDRPVILVGTDGTEAHAWVCDGYASAYYCELGVTTLHFHMNWGWLGEYDAYFAYNNFNPDTYSFNTNRKMVTGIQP